jgi:predicted ATPase/class 3 adenylate cyclase
VTFLFATVSGAVGERSEEEQRLDLIRYDATVRAAVELYRGQVFESVADAIYAVFANASDAAAAALAAQRQLVADAAEGTLRIRVRMALHSGYAEPSGEHYIGAPLYRSARLMAIAHGSQVLVSGRTAQLIENALPEPAVLRGLGMHRLKDLAEPEHVFQLVHPDLPVDFPPLKSLSVLQNNLPSQLTSFVGRESEIVEVGRLLAGSRLVTLLGPGGVGKTRLALQVAADLIDAYPDGVWLVELAALADPALVTQEIAKALGLREETDRAIADTLLDFLRTKHALILLDNCEHVLAACAAVVDRVLAGCPQVRVLATSRQTLGIREETAWPVPPLRVPDPARLPPVDALTRYEAVRLFADRATSVQPAFRITERNARAIAQIAHRLDGIPLALELAAARVAMLAPEQLASRLQDRFQLLTRGSRTALPRHQTLRAVVDWSYGLLPERERTFFDRLSVFAGGWTREAAEDVCAGDGLVRIDVPDLLAQTVAKSLAVVDPGSADRTRYRLLETLREYGRERLEASGTADEIQRRHASFFVTLAETAEPELLKAQQTEWLNTLDLEHDNVRAALKWCMAKSRALEAWRIGGALYRYWHRRGLYSEARAQLAAALALPAGDAADELLRAARAKALHGAAFLAAQQGDYAASRELFEASLRIRRELGDRSAIASVLNNLGVIARHQGDLATAQAFYEESLGLYRELEDRWAMTHLLNNLGMVAHQLGDLSGARRLLTEGLELRKELGDKWGVANSLDNLGNLARDEGDHAAARALYRESVTLARELQDRRTIAVVLEDLTHLAVAEGDAERALILAEAASKLREEIGAPIPPADRAKLDQALVTVRAGMPEEAQDRARAAGRRMTWEDAVLLVVDDHAPGADS